MGALIASVFIAYRSLFNHVKRVANEIEFSLDRGRAAVGHIVGRDPKTLDEHGVAHKERARQRQKQEDIANKRGRKHVGAVMR